MHIKSDSDVTSLAASSPPHSPKHHRAVYYVQSPSRDSNDGDNKWTTMHASPTESPSHPSYGRHSRASSASRVSGHFKGGGSGRKRGGGGGNEKGWPECKVIEEEGEYDFGEKGCSRRCQIMMALFGFVIIFSIFCLILWGASRPYKARVTVKSLVVHNFYFGEGSDMTGVPTKMLTVNCTVRMNVYNPATFFGIHVSSDAVNLMYSEIAVATGQLKKYYQPRKSHRNVIVNLQGVKVPLYGAGASIAADDTNGGVPLTLVFDVRSRGNVVGRLVRSKHRRHVTCSMVVDSRKTKPITFKASSCLYK